MVRNSSWAGGSISLHPSGPAALLSVPAKELVSRPLNLRRRRAGAGPAGRPHLQPRRRHHPGQATPACWSDCWAQPGLDRSRRLALPPADPSARPTTSTTIPVAWAVFAC